jgi:hypothetical protein
MLQQMGYITRGEAPCGQRHGSPRRSVGASATFEVGGDCDVIGGSRGGGSGGGDGRGGVGERRRGR